MQRLVGFLLLCLVLAWARPAEAFGSVTPSTQSGTMWSFNTTGRGEWVPAVTGTGFASAAEACAVFPVPTPQRIRPGHRVHVF